jgi:succinate-semialdehyde dehydrogenase/glutarate-semialdehyde dehydrogenase
MLKAIDPTSGKCIRELPSLTPVQTEQKLQAAQRTYMDWRHSSFQQRGEVLRAVATQMRHERENLAQLMTQEMGKPIKEGRAEVDKSIWCAEHYAEHAEGYLARQDLASDATMSYVQHRPLGPVLGILPWNAPMWLAFRFCAPALMAGNTCLMKHDTHVPGTAQAIEQVFADAGAPQGLLCNLPLHNAAVEAVIRDPRVRAVSFTGSDRAGAQVAAIAASEIKPAVLELGGSDPCIVLADAELERAADVITLSRTINAGQNCIAAKRIIVEAAVYDQMVDLLKTRLQALVVGDPREESTQIGPLAREDLRDNLARQVTETIAAGARCLLGGKPVEGPGFFYPVTLLTDVQPGMTAFCEETFGPVAVVIRARDEAHALQLANDTPYGLGAGIWTEARRGEALARDIEAGQVAVNGIVKTDPRLPSGGIKRSGYGRELGPHGIHAFVNAQQVWIGPTR